MPAFVEWNWGNRRSNIAWPPFPTKYLTILTEGTAKKIDLFKDLNFQKWSPCHGGLGGFSKVDPYSPNCTTSARPIFDLFRNQKWNPTNLTFSRSIIDPYELERARIPPCPDSQWVEIV